MAEKILGIDIGSKVLKVVQLSRTLRTARIEGYASKALPPEASPPQIAETLRELLAQHGLEGDRFFLTVGCQDAFLRRVALPFTSERKIAQVLGFEIEATLPVALEEVVVDSVLSDDRADGSHSVLAVAFPRRVLTPYLEAFREIGIVPELVDLDGGVLGVIAGELAEQIPERTLLLDIGHRKTNFLLRKGGRTSYLRALAFGCSRLADTFARSANISLEDAFKQLFAHGFNGQPAGTGKDGSEGEVRQVVQAFAREVEMTLLAAQEQETAAPPELVLLLGGGSLIKGFAALLGEELQLPVRRVTELTDLGVLGQFQDLSNEAPIYAVATAAALRAARRKGSFNLQATAAPSLDPLVRWRPQIIYGLMAAALVALSWLGSVGADIYAKNKQLQQLDRAIETVIKRELPELSGSLKPSQYVSVLKGKVDELKQTAALFGSSVEQYSTVEVLRAISEAIPPDLQVSLQMLSMDQKQVRLNGRADSFGTVDKVKNRLMESPEFSKVNISGAKAAKDGKGVDFSIELQR
ncbi:MAG: pilus assembly protein PilM [Deltaproteobacteria bacterium]|nr:pilus assembly protein PilM [Deltaproteobacteria bacterium]MBW2071651.1 pilus assembly protein PilM [Deltaproteobacteria bacterium]